MLKYMILLSTVALFTLGKSGMGGGSKSDFPFKAKWNTAEKYMDEGKPKSALEVIEEIYAAAINVKAKPHILRSIIMRHKITLTIEEIEYATLIQRMEQEIASSQDKEVTALLQSATASMYTRYVINHSYRLKDRITLDSLGSDVNTWSIADIEKRADELILRSLELSDIDDLSLEDFELHSAGESKVSPISLKPYLIQQGIYHFESDITSMTKIGDGSTLPQSLGLAPLEEFLEGEIESELSIGSRKDNTLILYQRLLAYYIDQPVISAKADLNRLRFAEETYQSQKQTIADLQSDYFNALRQGMKQSKDPNQQAVYGITLAKLYYALRFQYQNQYDPAYANIAKQALDIATALRPTNNTLKSIVSAFQSTVNSSHIHFAIDDVVLPQIALPFALDARNISQVDLSLYKLTTQEYQEAIRNSHDKNLPKTLKGKTFHSEWVEELALPVDYLDHKSELILPALDLGHYAMFVSGKSSTHSKSKDIEKFVLFQVSNQDVVKWVSENGNNIQVTDRLIGKPQQGAKIELYTVNRNNRNYSEKLQHTATTDRDGQATINGGDKGQNMSLVSTIGNDVLLTDLYYQRRSTQRPKRSKPHVFMDRSIYRPGQMLHGKLVHLTYDSDQIPHILKDSELVIRLKDPNNQEVETQTIKTNRYGVSMFSMTVPTHGLKGNYRLYFEHPDGNSSTQVKVEEYRRPTLESSFGPIEGTVSLGDSVKVTGMINTLSGFPSQGAKVTYTISESSYNNWRPCGWSYWWYPPHQGTSKIVDAGETKTNELGRYTIDFNTDSDDMKRQQTGKRYTVDVVITDQSGETLTQTKTLYVTPDHFRIDHTLPSIINLDSTDQFTPSVVGLNLDEAPIKVTTQVTIQRMSQQETYVRPRRYGLDYIHYTESDFERRQTHYDYPTLGKGEAVDPKFKKKTVELQSLGNTLEQLQPGDYRLTIIGTSEQGDQSEVNHRILLYDSEYESPHMLLYTAKNALTATVGSELQLPLLIHNEVTHVYYKKIRGAKILEEGWLSRKTLVDKKWQIAKADMGGFTLELSCNLKGERVKTSLTIAVPYEDTNIDLTLQLDSLLLPGTDYQLETQALCDGLPLSDANLTLVMYDAALDQLYPHSWQRQFYPTFYSQVYEQELSRSRASVLNVDRYHRNNGQSSSYLDLQLIPRAYWYGIMDNMGYHRKMAGRMMTKGRNRLADDQVMYSMDQSQPAPSMMPENAEMNAKNTAFSEDENQDRSTHEDQSQPPVRSDFSETTFFDTDGYTDEEGNYSLDFKTNDAVTQWKILAFAHDQEMRFGFAELITQTRKPIQIIQTPTRTLSEGDQVQWPITVQNSSETESKGHASIQVLSYLTRQDVTDQFITDSNRVALTIPKGQARTISFDLVVPSDYKDRVEIITRYLSEGGSDAESRHLPIYSTDQYLTSGDPIWLRPRAHAKYAIVAPTESKTETLTLEIASNPFWMVARSFPMLAERDTKVTTTLSGRIVVESIGRQIIEDYPDVERVMTANVIQEEGTPLNRNNELKIQSLHPTPWVRQAMSEENRVSDFAKYFNKNNSIQRLTTATDLLWTRQKSDGGWPWIIGGRSSLHTTTRVLIDLGQIQELGVSSQLTSHHSQLQDALDYIDAEIDIIRNRSKYKEQLPSIFIDNLYLYSLMPSEIKRPGYHGDWLRQLESQWNDLSLPYQALVGKIAIKNNKNMLAQSIKESLLQRAITRDDGTVFWREINEYYTYHNSYSTQALVLDFLRDAGESGDVIDRGSHWLIANKRSNEWYDERGTAAVVYHLYQHYGAKINDGSGISVTLNGKSQQLRSSITYSTLEIDPSMYDSDLTLEVNNSEDYPVFGGVYRQFFQPIESVSRHPAAQNLTIAKSIYVKSMHDNKVTYHPLDSHDVRVGDELIVRLEIEAFDRLSYVYVTDSRPSGTEPSNQISGYNAQNGLYLYQSPSDRGHEFFLDVLPKGKHTLEYALRVMQAGDYTSGVAEIQSFYVPEFSAYDSYGRLQTLPLSLDPLDN